MQLRTRRRDPNVGGLMKTTPTTLDLARMIANAVLKTDGRRNRDSTRDAPTQAVLTTLRRNRHWFMRIDENGTIVGVEPGGPGRPRRGSR